MKQFVWALASLFLFVGVTFAAEKEVKPDHQVELYDLRGSVKTVKDLEARGVLGQAVANSQVQFYLDQASTLQGSPMTIEQLSQASLLNVQNTDDGFWKTLGSYFTFVNILLFIASILIVVGASWVFVVFILPALNQFMTVYMWEVLIYLACFGLMVAGKIYFTPSAAPFVALLGYLSLIGAVRFTLKIHKYRFKQWEKPQVIISLLMTLAYAAFALWYGSQLLGFLAVVAFMSYLGFSVWVLPMCYAIGFDDDGDGAVISRAVGAAFIMVGIFVAQQITGFALGGFDVFSVGIEYMGSFVYFIGLLILSSKWIEEEYSGHFALMQFIMIGSGIGAMFLGSFWDLGVLRSIGGTFLALWAVEKYIEIVDWEHWAWGVLGLGLLLYGAGMIAQHHPEYFLLM